MRKFDLSLQVAYLVYANVGSMFAGGPEATAIADGLARHGILNQIIALDDSSDRLDVLTPVPLRWVVPRVLDRLSRLSRISLRYVNERLLDVFASRQISANANMLLTSCLAPKSIAVAKARGLTTIFYAKNAFNFYRVLREESEYWGIPVPAGELDYVRRYEEVVPVTDFFISLFTKDTEELNNVYGIHPSRVLVVRNGIDVKRFAPRPKSALEGVTFAYLGMSPLRKGLPYLLEAWRRMRGNCRLIVAGLQPNMLHRFKERWNDLRNVLFYGPVDPMWLYEQADVYVAVSLAEGQPRATLEAMASGLPVIATETGSGGAVRPGQDGILVPERNVEALHLSMEELMSTELRQRMGASARERVVADFQIDDFGERIAEAIKHFAMNQEAGRLQC